MRTATWVALALVITQGVLGGARVLLDDRQLAMIHGCFGPAFFAYCVGLASLVNTAPRGGPANYPASRALRLHRFTLLTAMLVYVQLVLGAQMRHIPVTSTPLLFNMSLFLHLANALVLTAAVLLLGVSVWRGSSPPALRRPVSLLVGLVCLQLVLGVSTWIVEFGWPYWFSGYSLPARYTVQAKSMLQTSVTTMHMAVGSLILATSVLVHLRARRSVPVALVPLRPPEIDRGNGEMSTTTVTVQRIRAGWLAWIADLVELSKPRIGTLVVISVAVAYWVAAGGQPDMLVLLGVLPGTLLVAASASALNQLMERRRDALMERTAQRPLPGARLRPRDAPMFSIVSLLVGIALIAASASLVPLLWTALTWLLYVFVYTPSKIVTPLNTLIGAIPGAMPILIGWSAAGALRSAGRRVVRRPVPVAVSAFHGDRLDVSSAIWPSRHADVVGCRSDGASRRPSRGVGRFGSCTCQPVADAVHVGHQRLGVRRRCFCLESLSGEFRPVVSNASHRSGRPTAAPLLAPLPAGPAPVDGRLPLGVRNPESAPAAASLFDSCPCGSCRAASVPSRRRTRTRRAAWGSGVLSGCRSVRGGIP